MVNRMILILFLFFFTTKNMLSQIEPWQPTTQLDNQQTEVLFIDHNNVLYAGTFGGGLFKSSDNGSTWHNLGLRYYSIKWINVSVLGELYVGTTLGLFYTNDSGNNWKDITPNLNTPNDSKEVSSISIIDTFEVFVSFIDWGYNQSGVFYSENKGNSWVNKTKISSYSMQVTQQGEIYLGTQNKGLLFSADKGNNWSADSVLMTVKYVYLIDSNKIIIGQQYGSIFYSENRGQTWDLLVSSISYSGYHLDHNLNRIIVDKNSSNLFVSLQHSGVYKYSFENKQLYSFNNGLPALYSNGKYYSIVRDNSNNLFLGTNNYGVYKHSGDFTVNIDDPMKISEFNLHQNYPNPFNPVTRISYSVSFPSFVSITIYDILGREVSILINENKSVGNYTIDFDGTGLPSGIYLYQMKANDFVDTKKMILLR